MARSCSAPVAKLGAGVAGRLYIAFEEAVWAGACPAGRDGAGKALAPKADAPKGLFPPGC